VTRRAAWALGAAVLAAIALWATAREPSAPGLRPSPVAARPSPAAEAPSAAPTPERAARNVFRFADESRDEGGGAPREPAGPPVDARPAPTPESGPRLVGVVRRGGRTLAALAQGGEVELAGPGESAAGVVVVAIGDEGVRIRRHDGTETLIPLP
jgi:hypothetical protein